MIKQTLKRALGFALAALLLFGLCLTPAAALTPQQLKELLQELYIDEVDDAVLSEETIEGILEALGDPYTRYMTADEFALFMASMSDDEFGGIGISAGAVEEGLELSNVYEGLPAAAAGLVPGDIITAVDGILAEGVSAALVSEWLRGAVGSRVTVTVKHRDGRVENHTLTRALVVIPKTVSELIGKIGYINCSAFGDATLTHFANALESGKGASVWMVDLRNNGGGSVDAAVQSLGLFLGEGYITHMRNGRDEYISFLSEQKEQTMAPLIVLTSAWSASAAEIFTAVVRDSGAGLVIGEKTYGKGVAQVFLWEEHLPDFFPEGDAVTITAYRYYTHAAGNTADKIGVIPHLLVDAQIAGEIGMLLGEEETSGGSLLRLNIGGWRWYVDPDTAASPERRAYFTALLEALPPGTALSWREQGVWADVQIETLVERYGLTDYRARGFTDVGSDARADQINTLACYDILRGGGDGSFRPEETLTRAELCALLTQAMGLKSGAAAPFADVPADAWYAGAVSAAYTAGLVSGLGDGRFDPEGRVESEQLIAVMGRAATFLNAALYAKSKQYDASSAAVPAAFSDWAKPAAWLLDGSLQNLLGAPVNLLYRSSAQIDPKAAVTRAETAQLLYNLYLYTGILTQP